MTEPVKPIERIKQLKHELESIYEPARTRLAASTPGLQISATLADRIQQFILRRVEEAITKLPAEVQSALLESTAVIAVGGTGRGELSFSSDADVLFLHRAGSDSDFEELASTVLRDCWDAKLDIGHKVRSLSGAISDAKQDVHFATSLVHANLIWGSEELFQRFEHRFKRRVVKGHTRRLFNRCLAAREEEWREHGGCTVSQLKPNIKKSRGGLRDLHLLRWLSFFVFGVSEIDVLTRMRIFRKQTRHALEESLEFLLRLRLELHELGGTDDILTRELQVVFAERRGIEAKAGQRPVEVFMRTYFEHASVLAETLDAFIERYKPRPVIDHMVGLLTQHWVDRIYRVSHARLEVPKANRSRIGNSISDVLQLFLSAMLHGVEIGSRTKAWLRELVPELDQTFDQQARTIFLQILQRTVGLSNVLRSMDKIGLLHLIIPQWHHVRFLLQFNQYHNYTVDEHTMRVLEAAEELWTAESALGSAYRSIKRKEVFHLALLLHDAGKGFPEDHSIRGGKIAADVADRLALGEHQKEMLVFLIEQHLSLEHLAFHRDYMDPNLQFQFAKEIGSPEVLKMLYVLTACDMSGVGSGVWTDWKEEIATDLFNRLHHILTGEATEHEVRTRIERLRADVKEFILEEVSTAEDDIDFAGIEGDELADWVEDQLSAFSPNYIMGTPNEVILSDLQTICSLDDAGVVARGEFDEVSQAVCYRVICPPLLTDGCFHRMTGVLTGHRLEILTADIFTSRDGIAIDQFYAVDTDFAGEPPPGRIDEVCEDIKRAVTGEIQRPEIKRRNERLPGRTPKHVTSDLPTRITIDNKASETETVIDVFAHDRPGLLYQLTRTLSIHNLNVTLARISTHLDQVADVFYITDDDGQKISDGDRLREIRDVLTQCVEELDTDPKVTNRASHS